MSRFPWNFVFLSLFPPLFLYVQNVDIVQFSEAAPAIIASLLVFFGVFLSLRQTYGSQNKAALFTSFLILSFYSFGQVHGQLHGLFLSRDFDVPVPGLGNLPAYGLVIGSLLILIYAYLSIWIFRKIKRSQSDLRNFSKALTAISAVLLIFQPVVFLMNEYSVMSFKELTQKEFFPPFTKEETTINGIQKSEMPDIYFIVPDGYARSDILESVYGHDNSSFTDALKDENFQIASNSTSAFYWTFLSMTSTFNMDYVTDYQKVIGPKGRIRTLPNYHFRYNRAAQFLKSIGYEFVQTESTWIGAKFGPYADQFFPCFGTDFFSSEYFGVLVETSLLRPFVSTFGKDLVSCHLKNFNNLKTIAKSASESPKFVLSHFVLPHHPYLFDSQGNFQKYATISNQFDFQNILWEKKSSYIEQLQYVNQRLLEVVREIRSNSKRPAVIIIASDHGVHVANKKLSALAQNQERFKNFIAVSSNKQDFQLPADINLVNVLRHVFNAHLGTSFKSLPQKTYYSKFSRPYSFKEIPQSKATKVTEAR